MGSSNKNGDHDFALLHLTSFLVQHDVGRMSFSCDRDVFSGGHGCRAETSVQIVDFLH